MRKLIISIVMFAVATSGVLKGKTVLDSSLAGNWYPENAGELNAQFADYLSKVKEKKLNEVIALILPHAGYRYSGQTAAYGIKEISGKKYSRVIVIGPTHHVRMNNQVSVPSVSHYRTPLGEIPLDTEFIADFKKNPFVISAPEAHSREHSVQIEVPLLQYALKNFSLVPIVVGQLDDSTVKKIALALLSLIDDRTLVIASSDFTHYGNRFDYTPFGNDFTTQERIKKLDAGAIEQILKKDETGFADYVDKTGATICGRDGIRILLAMLPPQASVHLLNYATSGQMMNTPADSVSYAAIAITGKWKKTVAGTPEQVNSTSQTLNNSDQQTLLKTARNTIDFYFKNRKVPTMKDLKITISPNMEKVMGAFVTLHKNGELRGCIGEIQPRRPVYQAVIAQALNAAFNDYRFPQLQAEELPEIELEISALTPSKPVTSWRDIVIGRDGIVLEKNGRSAVFLPQVATEQGWTLPETLSYLARKAGLASDDWKNGTSFMVFQAEVFGEKKEKK